jgi:hypothetical protein
MEQATQLFTWVKTLKASGCSISRARRTIDLGIMRQASERSTSAILMATRSIMPIIIMSSIDVRLVMAPTLALASAQRVACHDRYHGRALTLPQFFDGLPAKKIEHIPRDDGWHFSRWRPGEDDYYLVCHYGSTSMVTLRVQRGATACLFGNGKDEPDVYCR